MSGTTWPKVIPRTLTEAYRSTVGRPFAPGETLIEAGTGAHDEMYVVIEGEVEIFTHGKPIEVVGPGGIFGEMALVDSGPRSASAIGKAAGKVVPIDQKRFVYLIGNTPFFAIEVMQVMAKRLRRMNEAS